MNKKAIYFSMISIMLAALFLLLFSPKQTETTTSELDLVSLRITQLDDFTKDLEEIYIDRLLRVSAARAIDTLTDYVIINNLFVDVPEVQDEFYNLVTDGEIDGVSQTNMKDTGYTYILPELLNTLEIEVETALNAEITLNLVDVQLLEQSSESGAWNIPLEITADYELVDAYAKWNKQINIITNLSIEGFIDPFIASQSKLDPLILKDYLKPIKKSTYSYSEWDDDGGTELLPPLFTTTRLEEFIAEGYYRHDAALHNRDFLHRFTFDTTNSDCCAIETLIDPTIITGSTYDWSYVDKHFFTPSSRSSYNCWSQTDPDPATLFEWDFLQPTAYKEFKLDPGSQVIYGIGTDELRDC